MIGLNHQLEQHLRNNDEESSSLLANRGREDDECQPDGDSITDCAAKEASGETKVPLDDDCSREDFVSTKTSKIMGIGWAGGVILGCVAAVCSSEMLTVLLEKIFPAERLCVFLVFRTAAVVLLLLTSIKYYFLDRNTTSWITHHSQKEDTLCHNCRMKIAALLGSVGAPPLLSLSSDPSNRSTALFIARSNQHVDWKTLKDTFDMLVLFTRAHTALFLALDRGVEILRIGTGLHLGLGPSSHSVERVEMSTLYCRDNKLGQKKLNESVESSSRQNRVGRRKGTVVAMHSARRIVWKIMVIQRKSLEGVLDYLLEKPTSDDRIDTEPQPISLFGLKRLRRELAELLSQTLSLLTTVPATKTLASSPNNDLYSALQQSIWTVKEAHQHVTGAFAVGPVETVHDASISTPSGSTALRKHLVQLCSQLDGIYVSLWEFENVMAQRGEAAALNESNSAVGESCGVVNESETINSWLSRVDHLLATAVEAHDQLQISLKGNRPQDNQAVNEVFDVTLKDHSPEASPDSRLAHYEHSGENSFASQEIDAEQTLRNSKTAVFAGTGALDQPSVSGQSCYQHTEAEAASNARNQANLMYELTSRLGMMDLVEEIDMTGSNAGVDLCTENNSGSHDTINGHSPASSLFLGASGSLLAELKSSIQSNDTGASESS